MFGTPLPPPLVLPLVARHLFAARFSCLAFVFFACSPPSPAFLSAARFSCLAFVGVGSAAGVGGCVATGVCAAAVVTAAVATSVLFAYTM